MPADEKINTAVKKALCINNSWHHWCQNSLHLGLPSTILLSELVVVRSQPLSGWISKMTTTLCVVCETWYVLIQVVLTVRQATMVQCVNCRQIRWLFEGKACATRGLLSPTIASQAVQMPALHQSALCHVQACWPRVNHAMLSEIDLYWHRLILASWISGIF